MFLCSSVCLCVCVMCHWAPLCDLDGVFFRPGSCSDSCLCLFTSPQVSWVAEQTEEHEGRKEQSLRMKIIVSSFREKAGDRKSNASTNPYRDTTLPSIFLAITVRTYIVMAAHIQVCGCVGKYVISCHLQSQKTHSNRETTRTQRTVRQ